MADSLDSGARMWVRECSRLGALRTVVIARGMHGDHCGEAGAKHVLQRMPWVERDLHRDSLHYLGEVAGCVIGRQQCKLRSASRSDLNHLPMQDDSREGIDPDVCLVSLAHVGELGLLIVGLDPDI